MDGWTHPNPPSYPTYYPYSHTVIGSAYTFSLVHPPLISSQPNPAIQSPLQPPQPLSLPSLKLSIHPNSPLQPPCCPYSHTLTCSTHTLTLAQPPPFSPQLTSTMQSLLQPPPPLTGPHPTPQHIPTHQHEPHSTRTHAQSLAVHTPSQARIIHDTAYTLTQFAV